MRRVDSAYASGFSGASVPSPSTYRLNMQNAAAISTVSWISEVGGAFGAGGLDQFGGDLAADLADRCGDPEQRAEFRGDRCGVEVGADLVDQGHASVELGRGESRVATRSRTRTR